MVIVEAGRTSGTSSGGQVGAAHAQVRLSEDVGRNR
jgi:hypothetical protein